MDFDNDGVHDLAIGAPKESFTINGKEIPQVGAIYIFLMTINGTIKNYSKISFQDGNGPMTYENDQFGFSLAYIGDLDGDGVGDLAVGAPGDVVSSVFILFLNSNLTVKKSVLIRGVYNGDYSVLKNTSYPANGPPIFYKMGFGTSLADLGDLDLDGTRELAVGSLSQSVGNDTVFILYLFKNGTVRDYTVIGSNIGGGPNLLIPFSGFGSAIANIGDINMDNITDIAIGAKYYEDFIDANFRSGAIFICTLNRNGTVQESKQISIWSQQLMGFILPWQKDYFCGSAIMTNGDINLDNMRGHKPTLPHPTRVKKYNDYFVGCPAPDTGSFSLQICFFSSFFSYTINYE
jgi:hypothetical protein